MLDADVLTSMTNRCAYLSSFSIENMEGLNPMANDCLIKMCIDVMDKACGLSEVKLESVGNSAGDGLKILNGIIDGGQSQIKSLHLGCNPKWWAPTDKKQ